MAPVKKGLGKGLSALMAEEYSQTPAGAPDSERDVLPLTQLAPGKYQPRHRFQDDSLSELADSIRRHGVMQPVLVRPLPREAQDVEARYEIIAGERRWRAARSAGLTEIPVVVRELDDSAALELALIENIQRQDLSPLEEAAGYQRLIDEFAYTQETLAGIVGKSRSHVTNLMRLLGLPDGVKAHLDAGRLTMGHARALLGGADAERLADEAVRRGLNVRQVEALVRGGNAPRRPRRTGETPSRGGKDPDILALEESLSESLGLSVSIDDRGQAGSITIGYETLTQLDDVLKRLGGGV